ncbi:hypothetical protein BOX15_Mlig018106g3 [Macrostomum lignano]|uniref:Innexin n=2 Tax=Macrostomum lignano TaxID=282301 RepID=A0A267FWB2_9PLAT|nr:hypothetical protein BOX15_Mlig018106g3 [Macrostomum lignano]
MAAAEIFAKFTKLPGVSYAGVEDLSDRLHFQVTVVLLLVCCTTITVKSYILSPVACFMPNEVGSHTGQEQFVNNFCWTEGTFAVPLSDFHIDNTMRDPLSKYEPHRIIYYQWVPFVLGLQAICFYLPRVLWELLSRYNAGTDIQHLVQTANDAVQADGEKHEKLVQHITRRLCQLLSQGRKRPAGGTLSNWRKFRLMLETCFIFPSARLGNWLIVTYLLIKLLCLTNGILQLWIMHAFLGFNTTYFAFGYQLLHDLSSGRGWQNTMLFPRVSACAIPIKSASKVNYVASQCTLPINMLNEKIYLFFWFWTVFITVVTLSSLPRWFTRVATIGWRVRFVKNYLRLLERHRDMDKRDLHRFVRDFLRLDGTFLLKMIALNSGDVICTEIVGSLVDAYLCQRNASGAQLTDMLPSAPAEPHTLLRRYQADEKPAFIDEPADNDSNPGDDGDEDGTDI